MSVAVHFEKLHYEVQNELKKAENSVSIAVAWITFNLYSDIFKELIKKGVTVDILCTNSPTNQKQSELISQLVGYGVNIRLCHMPRQTNHMHHKFAVIDSSVVLNGSFNWSENAKRSFENLTIIYDEPEIVSSFIHEFDKIKNLDKEAIKSLQSTTKCNEQNCDGETANILVFQESPMRMIYELWGDIVQCCSVCGDISYSTLKSGIQDTYLHHLFSKSDFDLNEEEIVQFDRDIDSHLTGYSSCGVVIHGIGFVCREIIGKHREDIYTRIIWKNKFVNDAVRDRYETDFNVSYN